MRRRIFVGGVVTGVLGLAGCSSQTTESPESDPDGETTEAEITAVLETHWETYRNQNVEGFVATHHSESPKRDEEPWNSDEFWGTEDSQFSIEKREIDDSPETGVTVTETVRGDNGENTSRWLNIVELRRENDEWKVWDYQEEPVESSE